MKKKILIPTDFSKNAWSALSYAIELYKEEDCNFYLLNVYSVSSYVTGNMMAPEPGEMMYEASRKVSREGLDRLLKKLSFRDEYSGHKYETISAFGSLIETIKDIVAKKDIELIVMGTKGATNAIDIAFGSNTVSVMEKVRNCPVLAIPPDIVYFEPREIAFPTSFKTHYKRRELKYLVEISKITNAPIRILHVSETEELSQDQIDNKQLLEEIFDGSEFSFHTLRNTDVQTGLDCFVQSRDIDMVAFINKKHNFFASIFSRPMVKTLGEHSKVPVLALHDFRN